MNIQQYLPSTQFTLLVGSLLCAGGLIFLADRAVNPYTPPGNLSAITNDTNTDAEWQTSLAEIQAQNADTALPTPPDQNTVDALLKSAQSGNLTESIGRTLLVNITNAKAQGLGDDIPTQDKLVASALTQIQGAKQSVLYTQSDLKTVASSAQTLKAYGNILIQVMVSHPKASAQDTFLAIGYATDNNDPSKLAALADIEREYRALAKDLSAVPVPTTLAPLHLQIINNFSRMADALPDLTQTMIDPLRGAAGLQVYNAKLDETGRVFTNIAQQLAKSGILFSKDEPGSALQSLVSSQ